MHIYFCGFMGSGKSALGRIVAQKLNRPFFDLDDVIELEEERSISEIFAEDGESVFREIETQILNKLAHKGEPAVISLGGGAVINPKNRAVIQTTGKLVYLRTTVELLVKRLKNSRKRPKLLKEDGSLRNEAELKNLIQHMLSKREPSYMNADLIVDIREHKPKNVTAGIIFSKIINQYPNLT